MKLLLSGIQPVSANNMYFAVAQRTKFGKVMAMIVPTKELKEYKSQIKSIIEKATLGLDPLSKEYFYQLNIEVSYPADKFFNKDGSIKQRDASNVIKALEDGVYEALGVNDKQNMRVSVEKFYNRDNENFIYVEIIRHDRTLDEMERGSTYYNSVAK